MFPYFYWTYNGTPFFGTCEKSDDCYHGKIVNILDNDLVTYEAESNTELFEQFKNAIVDYWDFCIQRYFYSPKTKIPQDILDFVKDGLMMVQLLPKHQKHIRNRSVFKKNITFAITSGTKILAYGMAPNYEIAANVAKFAMSDIMKGFDK